MFDRYTDKARKVMGIARQEAQRAEHEYIGTEHLVLGLVKVEGISKSVLEHFKIDYPQVRDEIAKLVQRGSGGITMGQLPFTPRIKRVMEFASDESSRLGHTYIGTEHLLLGIFLEGDNVAVQVLLNMGLNLESARAQVLELLGDGPKDRPWAGHQDDALPVYEQEPGGRECFRCSHPAQTTSQYCPNHVPSEAESILRDGLKLIIEGEMILDGESAAHLARITLNKARKASSRKTPKEERDAF
jgi:ATP-dependent Clp protease ATP-binding subunit ClpA